MHLFPLSVSNIHMHVIEHVITTVVDVGNCKHEVLNIAIIHCNCHIHMPCCGVSRSPCQNFYEF